MNFRPASSTKLPRRDLVILPLLSFLTIAFLLAGCEITARHFFADQETDSCQVDDSTIGFKFRPHCTTRVKTAEGPWVENYYNDCGYRTKEPCGPTPTGSTRVALIGSSVAEGWLVDYDHTLAARAAVDLTKRCRRPVQIQNLGRQYCSVGCMFHRVDEALALKPDVLVVAISPYDIETTTDADVADRFKPIPALHSSQIEIAKAHKKRLLLERLQGMVKDSRTAVAAEHYLFQDPETYLKMYLVYGDRAGFLRPPFSPAWEERLKNVDLLLGEIAQKARNAHVPLVLVEMPSLPQVSIVTSSKPPPQVSASALNERLNDIAQKYGIVYVDPLNTFRHSPGANKDFYVVNGHLNGDGYAYISAPLVDRLTRGPNPLIVGCTAPSLQTTGGALSN